VATMVRILENKGYIDHETFGNTFRYFALVPQLEYQSQEVDGIVKKYFNNSVSRMVAFFAKKENISKDELEEIMKIIKEKQP
jgi:predicted transcriptional regulator